MTRTALILAHGFPPAGGPGVQRSLKFVKYLPEYGWNSVVITATARDYPVLDPDLEVDVPAGTPIFRLRAYDINMLRPRFQRLGMGKLLSAINAAMFLPDANLPWALRARAAVKEAMGRQRAQVVYSSSSPTSAHLLGLWAHRTFGLPWVADFRDPWVDNELTPYLPGYRAINRRQERQVLRQADRIVTVSEPIADVLRRLSGRANDVLVIENGFDTSDVPRLPPPHTERFTIIYTGEFSRVRRPDAFIAAIDRLVEEGHIPYAQFRVAFAGKDIYRFIPDRPPYEQLGYLGHDALIELRENSDLLLLIHNDTDKSRGYFGGKFYEYLGSNRPILAITGADNVAAERLRQARAGTVVGHDVEAIMAAVLGYYRRWQVGLFDYAPDWNVIEQSTRRSLTGKLAAVFDQLAGT